MDSSSVNWAEKFDALGIALEPPVFSSPDLTKLFLWADVMLLPSRWEGAPLVIPECQQLGCIPICANVGAVDELIIDEVDGLLVASMQDEVTAASMAAQVRKLIDDDESRVRLALAGIQRGVRNQWETNFRPLMDWIDSAFADRRARAAAVQAIAPN